MPYKDIEQEYQREYRRAHKAVLTAQQGASFRLRRVEGILRAYDYLTKKE